MKKLIFLVVLPRKKKKKKNHEVNYLFNLEAFFFFTGSRIHSIVVINKSVLGQRLFGVTKISLLRLQC